MADQVITKQELIDAQKDAQTLEDVINGEPGKLIKTRLGRLVYTLASVPQINTMTREEVTSALAPKADKTETAAALDTKANQADTFLKSEVTGLVAPKADKIYVDSAVGAISTDGSKQYATLALATTDIANIALNKNIFVSEAANGGYWYKATAGATSLTKSPYDPFQQFLNLANSNPLYKSVELLAGSDLFDLNFEGYFFVKANAGTILNLPIAGNGFGFQSIDRLGNKTIWWVNQATNKGYNITKWNGAWHVWKEQADAKFTLRTTTQKSGAQTLAGYKENGVTTFSNLAAISDLPDGAPTGQQYTLEVRENIEGGRYKIQYLRCNAGTAHTGKKWERSLDTQTDAVGSWVFGSKLHQGQIVSENLSKSFRYKGLFTATETTTHLDDGLYISINAPDRPASASGSTGYIDVKNFSNSNFVFQTWTTHGMPNEKFECILRATQNPISKVEWTPLGGGSGGNSQFSGKKIVCFGDSITEFGTYPTQLASRLGAMGYNVGFGGCRWAKHINALYDPFSMYRVADYIATENLTGLMDAAIALRDSAQADDNTAAVTRLQSLDFSTVDYVTIFYGTNDFSWPNPIGTDSDTTGDTVKGAINLTLDKLLTKYPNLKIVLITPIWRARMLTGDGLESDSNPNSLGLYLRDYVEAIKDMGKKYHVPVLDLYNNSGINKYTKTQYLSSDELHPNNAGYTHLANLIAAKLSSTY